MPTVTVPALVHFTHEGQSYRRGDHVTVDPVVAAALARLGHVSIQGGYQVRDVVPESAPRGRGRRASSDPDRPKRQYRRRDLVAEP